MKQVITILFLVFFMISGTFVFGQQKDVEEMDPTVTEVWEPAPKKVDPGKTDAAPPSDAVVLFDGTNLDKWISPDNAAPKWKIEDGAVTVVPGTGSLTTKESFGDCQLHIEWRSPFVTEGPGQDHGNSGIFLQSRYEVQVLNNYENKTYANGQAGSIYKQTPPMVNACRNTGEWQSYDIIYMAPRFNKEGKRIIPGRITVLHNGVLVQNNTEIQGTTVYKGLPRNIAHGEGPLFLQDHGNPVSYRNIWIRRLD